MALPSRIVPDLECQQNWDYISRRLFPQVVTSLPSNPFNDQVIYYDAGAGVTWAFIYNASSGSAFKWEFIGGPPLKDKWTGSDARTIDGTYKFVPQAGTQVAITAPLAGEYQFMLGGSFQANTANACDLYLALHKTSNAQMNGDNEAWAMHTGSVNEKSTPNTSVDDTLTAGQVVDLRAKAANGAGTHVITAAWFSMVPLRVG